MKFWKHTLISAIAFVGVSSSVLYTSCTEDSCKTLICRNGATCADGQCKCPTGFEGTQCEKRAADRYIGFYVGQLNIDNQPPVADSARIWVVNYPATVAFERFTREHDVLIGNVSPVDGKIYINDGQFGGRTITISVIDKKIYFTSLEKPNGELQTINFVGTRRD